MFFTPDLTSITSLSRLFSLSSGSATCLRSASFCCVQSQQSPTKSNPLPSLMGRDIALVVSVLQRQRRRLQNVSNRQLTPYLCSVTYSISTEHYQNESYQITRLHCATNDSVLVQPSLRHFHLWRGWSTNSTRGAKWLAVHPVCMCTCL